MIGRLVSMVRDLRIRRHHARVQEFGFAVLAAKINRDWPAADEFHRYMQAERAKRDTLLAKQPRCCNHDCDEGAVAAPRAPDFPHQP